MKNVKYLKLKKRKMTFLVANIGNIKFHYFCIIFKISIYGYPENSGFMK